MMPFAAAALPRPVFDSEFLRDTRRGLLARRKFLPARWLYDDLGSALFEAITLLPEYGLTRADDRLMRAAAEEIFDRAGHPRLVIELGSGSGSKTRAILETAVKRSFVEYLPIDISRAALERCAITLGAIPRLRIAPLEATYLDGLDAAFTCRRSGDRALILFLGSTIGNFARGQAAAFLAEVRRRASAGDTLLLGADLIKPEDTLVPAYDDSLGVTAAFNLNLLVRMNRELDADFDSRRFAHQALWNPRGSRIEMHLESRIAQRVNIAALKTDIRFRAGETIWTESSHKFRPEQIRRMAERGGWRFERQWIDGEWPFAETLFVA